VLAPDQKKTPPQGAHGVLASGRRRCRYSRKRDAIGGVTSRQLRYNLRANRAYRRKSNKIIKIGCCGVTLMSTLTPPMALPEARLQHFCAVQ
jgi:hypothetical protein